MMVTLGICLRRWQRILRQWLLDPRTHALAQTMGLILAGFSLSAASLANLPLPLVLGLMMSLSGWPAALIGLGGALGYGIFWHGAGVQPVLWLCLGLPMALIMNRRPTVRATPWLMPATAGVIVAGIGLAMQLWAKEETGIFPYLLRIAIAIFATRLAAATVENQDPALKWVSCSLIVLALAQIRPFPYLGLGFLAAGILAAFDAFPAAALAGLALDLAQVTPTPMTAVLCFAWLLRLLPISNRWLVGSLSALCYLPVMYFAGVWDLEPLPGLLVGGLLSLLLPAKTSVARRRGETGFAQVRLEMGAEVLRQTGKLLQNVTQFPIDEAALMARAAERACGSCPCRKSCREDPGKMPTTLLHKPLGNGSDLPLSCRKSGRLLQELRRSQEQLRAIRADRDRQEEYRAAVTQQYVFLSDFLQDMSDSLSRRTTPAQQLFQPEIAVCSASRQGHNGDRCLWFSGPECRYYLLLCDGMGTGLEAAYEGKRTANMLKTMLCAGFPPEFALKSVNSLCALQGLAGAVTIDLAQIQLDTGRVILYKWGAAASYLIHRGEAIKIGTAAPPPGLSVTEGRETVQQLSLRKGEALVMLSDGAGGEESLRGALDPLEPMSSELAARILEQRQGNYDDDATVAVVRLTPLTSAT